MRPWFPISSGLLTWEHYQRLGPAWMVFCWMIHEQRAPKDGGPNTGAVRNGIPISNHEISACLGGMPARTIERHIALLERERYIRSEHVRGRAKRYWVTNPIRWVMVGPRGAAIVPAQVGAVGEVPAEVRAVVPAQVGAVGEVPAEVRAVVPVKVGADCPQKCGGSARKSAGANKEQEPRTKNKIKETQHGSAGLSESNGETDATAKAVRDWIQIKERLRAILSGGDYARLLRPAYLFRIAGNCLLVTIPPDGRISAALKTCPHIQPTVHSFGYSGVVFSVYPDDYQLEQLRIRDFPSSGKRCQLLSVRGSQWMPTYQTQPTTPHFENRCK